jgi:hypothetical protein
VIFSQNFGFQKKDAKNTCLNFNVSILIFTLGQKIALVFALVFFLVCFFYLVIRIFFYFTFIPNTRQT